MKRNIILLAGIAVIGAAVYLMVQLSGDDTQTANKLAARPMNYVGSQVCATCHQQETDLWTGSNHDLAMQHASDETVLGDFGDKQFDYYGTNSSFFKDGDRFLVLTDGPDGKLHNYQVKYTFGVEPLQQYLVELEGGRLQALHLAWDTRPSEQGGQRWFHLYPNEKIDYTDELHWTKLAQNWNYMCAECHSTNLKKNFDLATDTFHTTWSEINVSCEACHGPGSTHVAWANKDAGWKNLSDKGLEVVFNERRDTSWQFDGSSTIAVRSKKRETAKEIETCAHCHSRRSQLSEDYHPGKPLMDTHLPALLTEQLYFPDGQIKDEVYVYGSFLQSKMYHKGVTCSDCHEPHSLQLRAPGNQVCGQCHQASHYDSVEHHHHPAGSTGSLCSECHMPPRNFMIIDGRHDHSFRIPRPDLSERLNTPNACNQCHNDKSVDWAKEMVEQWYGSGQASGWHFGETLFAAREHVPDAGRELVALATSRKYPDIARASAASMLPEYENRVTLETLRPLLSDSSPLVRHAALEIVELANPDQRWQLAGRLLDDPVYAVRIEAARVLATASRDSLTPAQRLSLDRGVAEYEDAQLVNAELPQSHVNLGLLYLRLGDYSKAEAAYNQALQLDSRFLPGYINLADLYRVRGDEQRAASVLLKAAKVAPDDAAVAHAIGLHYVRTGKLERALQSLGQAAQRAPLDVRYAYVYGVALHDSGQARKALAELERAHQLRPTDLDVLVALVTYCQEVGETEKARRYAQKIADIEPRFGNTEQILERIGSNQ